VFESFSVFVMSTFSQSVYIGFYYCYRHWG